MGRNQDIDDLLVALGAEAPRGYFLALHIRFAAPVMMFRTYDRAWTDHYTRRAYALRDPMVAWGLEHSGATRWSAIDLPDPFAIMAEARSFGLEYGVCIGCGPMSSRTIAGVARGDREMTDEEIATISGLVLRLHHETEPPDHLTRAEKEALGVIAAGQRYAAGADALGISQSALKARLTSARTKLFARTTAEAIQRAKDYRLI